MLDVMQLVLQDKVSISNANQNIKTLIDTLIDTTKELANTVKSLQAVDPMAGNLPVDGGTQASLDTIANNLDNLKSNFNELLSI